MDIVDGRERAETVRWLKQQESQVLPHWISALRRRRPEAPSDTTQELEHHIFLMYYDHLCQAIDDGEAKGLDPMLRNLVADHFRQKYDIKEILQFPLRLKSILWRLILREFPLAKAEATMDQLEPVLNHSTGVLVEAYAQQTESSLNKQLEELDYLTQRLATRNAEMARALSQLHSLYNISKTISSAALDIHQTLETIALNLVDLPAIECCAIWLVTSAGTLQVGAIKGKGEIAVASVTLPLDESASFVTKALLARREQYLESPEDLLSPFLVDRDAVAIPMYNKDRPVGVAMINGRPQEHPFDPSIISLIQAATEQAAIALENAQLYSEMARFNSELEEKIQQRTAELEKANEELQRVNQELENLDRTKSDFINIAAHELKTPLTLIQGYTNIIREDSTVRRNLYLTNMLSGIIKGSDRLFNIIESMIDVSMIDTQVMQLRAAPTSIGALIRTAVHQYARDLKERRLELHTSDLSELPYIEVDAKRLHQVIENLLVNAIKYTPDGGRIEIDGRLMAPQGGNDWIEIVVSDTGIGIDPKHHERIFDKFYQTGELALHSTGKTKFRGGGPGLGLAIAKGIVDAHGGRIWVESEGYDPQGCPGSQFHVILPVKSMIKTAKIESPLSRTRSR